MKTKNLIKISIAGIIAFIFSLIFDKAIVNWSLNLRISFLNVFMKTITHDVFIVILILIGLIVLMKKREALVFFISIVVAAAIGRLLKWIIARPRPPVEHLVIENSFSMPSTHAIILFAMIPIFKKEYPKLLWLWLLIAILIIFSRLYLGVHYLSDLIVGAVLGYLIGSGIMLLDKKYKLGVF